MREVHLRNLDLNLLQPLYELLKERHVTRAAKRSFLSQPAMSRALERLREMFGDPLLVRSGRAYERTARGERVLQELGIVRGQPGQRDYFSADDKLSVLDARRRATESWLAGIGRCRTVPDQGFGAPRCVVLDSR